MKKRATFLLFCAVLAAGCSGNVRHDALADALNKDPYEFLAKRLSEAHDNMVNRKVAVLPFSYTDRRQSDDGVVISERLLTRIIEGKKLEVVERGLLEKVLGELKLQHSGLVDESSIKQLGKVLEVEAVVTGTLTRHKDGRVEINARLIRTESAAVLAAASGTVVPDWESRPVPQAQQVYVQQRPAPSARSQVQPPSTVPLRSDLVAYWKFDEGAGNIAADSSGNGYDGVLFNGPVWTPGKAGAALAFDGTDDYVEVPHSESLNSERITIMLWAKIAGAQPHEMTFIAKRPAANNAGFVWESDVGGTTFAHWMYIDGASRGIIHTYTAAVWYHIAATYDGSNYRLYVNGAEAEGSPIVGKRAYAPNTTPLRIGAGSYWPRYFNGLIDEIAIYNRALSPDEIRAVYDSGGGKIPASNKLR